MIPNSLTDFAETAIRFVNSTACHIFLTGKAGTGKTTFLKNLARHTHKPFAVVAPTGIAALNAGGVTIHSQFLMPFGMFLPEGNEPGDFQSGSGFYTSRTLARKHPLNSARKQVLRSIDLLVIDEVSMLRVDLLDAIDYRLKAARGNFGQSFGGVQLLLIGDLYQLPPVVKPDEERILKQHYPSPWFFESKALQRDGFVYIELDKIFRQHDDAFISVLNNLRNNQPTASDIDELNKHYASEDEIRDLKEVITLTTHNYKADRLNQQALGQLNTTSHFFQASIEGEFPENMFPVQQRMELKEGAQIMFIKNDNEGGMYFNGKLATIKHIEGKEVTVEMEGTSSPYILKKEVWTNKRYTFNSSTQEITDEVIGSFEQFPVKLAWAITVHKSQGLTFDKAIIDVEQAFADGQVYVALSRLRSLDGLILRTRIQTKVINTDKQVVIFTEANHKPNELPDVMKQKQQGFLVRLVNRTFDFDNLTKEVEYILRSHKDKGGFDEDTMQPVLEQIKKALVAERENTVKFRRQLHTLFESQDQTVLLERITRGSDYYRNILFKLNHVLLEHIEVTRKRKRVKGYVTSLTDLDQLVSKRIEEVDEVHPVTKAILEGGLIFDFSHLKENRAVDREKILEGIRNKVGTTPQPESKKKRNASRKKSGETYDVTLQLLQSGKSVSDIAVERNLAVSTIEGHMAKLIGADRLSIFTFLPKEKVDTIEEAMKTMPADFTSKNLFEKLDGQFTYGQIRAVLNHLAAKS